MRPVGQSCTGTASRCCPPRRGSLSCERECMPSGFLEGVGGSGGQLGTDETSELADLLGCCRVLTLHQELKPRPSVSRAVQLSLCAFGQGVAGGIIGYLALLPHLGQGLL